MMMSRSSPTVFTLAESQAQAEAISNQLRATLPDPDLDLSSLTDSVQLD